MSAFDYHLKHKNMTQANMDTAVEFLKCLRELVELKEIKETKGETEDYLRRKPLAWSAAKRLVYQNKYFGVKAEVAKT